MELRQNMRQSVALRLVHTLFFSWNASSSSGNVSDRRFVKEYFEDWVKRIYGIEILKIQTVFSSSTGMLYLKRSIE